MGRKSLPFLKKRVSIHIRLPQWLKFWLQRHGNQGKTIEEALIEKYKLKKTINERKTS